MEASTVPRAAPAGVAWQSPHLMRLASDARLVASIRDGRRVAFDVAYDRHHLSILSFCRHMLGDPQEAEDAVQHTFLAAYNDLMSSDKPIQLKAWLFAIARNRCYSVLRARREQPSADLAEIASEGLAAQVQRRQDLRDLVVDMGRLPNEQRAALVLAELDALSHEQIGVALGVPRERVKALVFQARESLLANRTARETDCTEIRAQLSSLRGGGLRRGNLRRHLRQCPGCRDFRHQVERQRRQLAVLLPVAPAVALKESVITTVLAGGAGAGAGLPGGAGVLAGTAVKSGLMKGAIGVAVAAVGAGTIAAAGDLNLSWSSSGLPLKHRLPPTYGGPGAIGSTPARAGHQSVWTAARRTTSHVSATPPGWRLRVSRTPTQGWPSGPSAITTYVSAPVPFGGVPRREGISVSRLAPAPAQSGPGQATAGSLAPIVMAPGGAAGETAASGPAPSLVPTDTPEPPDSGSGAGGVRIGHDGGFGTGTGTTSANAPSGPSGGVRGQDGSGTDAGGDGSGSTGSPQPGGNSRPSGSSVSGPSAPAGPGLGATATSGGPGATSGAPSVVPSVVPSGGTEGAPPGVVGTASSH